MTEIHWSYPKRILFAALVVVVLALLWQLADVLVLAFGAIVIAAIVRGLARRYEQWFGLSTRTSALLGTLSILALLGVAFWLVGGALTEQVGRLRESIPQAWNAAAAWLDSHALGRQFLEIVQQARESGISGSRIAGVASTALGALGSTALMLIVGIYLAVDPRLYKEGLVKLVPPSYRDRVRDALAASGRGLSCWLLGQGASMLFLGITTATGCGCSTSRWPWRLASLPGCSPSCPSSARLPLACSRC